jgi:hypothetical protein
VYRVRQLRQSNPEESCHEECRDESFSHFLTIKVDLTKDFGPSSSGKTIIIALTKGNVAVDVHEEAKVGLNVYRKK